MVKFSVLVPVYNVEQYIVQCLDSIINQTYTNYEVILVDDGSKDKSGFICEEYSKKNPNRIRVIHKKNEGLLSARRVGIEAATGEFCVFIDSDDYVDINLLDTINDYLSKDDEIDILMYSYRYDKNNCSEDRKIKVAEDGYIWEKGNKKKLYELFVTTPYIASIWTKAIRTELIANDPLDYKQYYDKSMSEDILQAIYPLTVAKKIVYADKVLYNYRINENSISRSFYPETIDRKYHLHVYHKILEMLPTWELDCQIIRDKLEARWFNDILYMMSNYFEAAKSTADKEKIMAYNWDKLLPDNSTELTNEFKNNAYKELYGLWKEKKMRKINNYFWRKKCYQKLKAMKKKLHF